MRIEDSAQILGSSLRTPLRFRARGYKAPAIRPARREKESAPKGALAVRYYFLAKNFRAALATDAEITQEVFLASAGRECSRRRYARSCLASMLSSFASSDGRYVFVEVVRAISAPFGRAFDVVTSYLEWFRFSRVVL